MRRRFYFAAAAIAVLLLFLSSDRSSAQHVLPLVPGWHALGPGGWHSENGEIVGTIRNNNRASAWLVMDRSYEDVGVRLSFKCGNCETGLLFMQNAGDPSGGTYVSLARADAGSTYRVTLDANGQEVDREPTVSQRPQTRSVPRPRIQVNPNEWNRIEVFVRGDGVAGSINGAPFRGTAAKRAGAGRYGPVALRISGGADTEVRYNAVSFEDLTERALSAEFRSDRFRKLQITDLFYSEGVAVGDFNKDGIQDIAAGAFYYPGPDYKVAREVSYADSSTWPAEPYSPGANSDTFQSYAYDFNGDGWPDLLNNRHAATNHHDVLYINPQGENRHWDKFIVVPNDTAETTHFVDVDGDGRPELIMSTHGQIGYSTPDWSNPTKPWAFHAVSESGLWGAHGFGYGDINGDGRIDIVHGAGWFEQPRVGTEGRWKFHSAPFGAGTDVSAYDVDSDGGKSPPLVTKTGGADILVYDVSGDGLADVITSLDAHGWGLAWFEQKRKDSGEIDWVRHMIMGNPSEIATYGLAFSQIHALVLADIDGDGLKDVVTGKRMWAHGDSYGEDPDSQSPAVLYWFKLVRKPGTRAEFAANQIDNNSGIGTQFVATDLNRDGAIDIVTSTRKGVFVFFNKP